MKRHSGNHTFSQVPRANIERSTFDRSHTVKTTFDSGFIVPIYCDEVLPGDTFKLNMNAFTRLATPLKPFMDNLFMDSFFFAVPIRLLWKNWQKFNGEQESPGDSTDYLSPVFNIRYVDDPGHTPDVGSLSDYLGIPPNVSAEAVPGSPGIQFSVFWHRAYHLIWNTWFRDENLQSPVDFFTGDSGEDEIVNYPSLLRRGKRHDYFTSCLPWPQKGPDVTIPLVGGATNIPVHGIANFNPVTPYGPSGTDLMESDGYRHQYQKFADFTSLRYQMQPHTHGDQDYLYQPDIFVTLDNAVAASINSLREAFQLQRLFERDARGGTRYTEIIRSHFGVTSPDARLQRPEYLGGGSTRINIHPLAQTSATASGVTPQGNLAAFGTGSISGHGFSKSFDEHCVILGMVSVRADLTYQEGLHRMFSRRTRFDYYWPALAHLGEQEVYNREIKLVTDTTTVGGLGNDDIFGYQERYAEYRYKPSIITGKFRSGVTGSLDVWHLAQHFSNMPTLSPSFIEEHPPIDRVVAVTSEPQFLFDAFLDLKCTRPMPVYGVPGLIDHF